MNTDATVDQIRAFANALKGDIGPGFGQDVVALCDRADYLEMSLDEEQELHGEARTARDSALADLSRSREQIAAWREILVAHGLLDEAEAGGSGTGFKDQPMKDQN